MSGFATNAKSDAVNSSDITKSLVNLQIDENMSNNQSSQSVTALDGKDRDELSASAVGADTADDAHAPANSAPASADDAPAPTADAVNESQMKSVTSLDDASAADAAPAPAPADAPAPAGDAPAFDEDFQLPTELASLAELGVDKLMKVLLQFGIHLKGMKNTKTPLKDRKEMLYKGIVEEYQLASTTNTKKKEIKELIASLKVRKSPEKKSRPASCSYW